jgi:hypothetical protein
MSLWDTHEVTDHITEILREVPQDLERGTGRAFITAYQLAIEFNRRWPQLAAELPGGSVGGEGQGPFALTTYLARWLPLRMSQGEVAGEFAFLGSQDIVNIEFADGINPTTIGSDQALTIFRLVER